MSLSNLFGLGGSHRSSTPGPSKNVQKDPIKHRPGTTAPKASKDDDVPDGEYFIHSMYSLGPVRNRQYRYQIRIEYFVNQYNIKVCFLDKPSGSEARGAYLVFQAMLHYNRNHPHRIQSEYPGTSGQFAYYRVRKSARHFTLQAVTGTQTRSKIADLSLTPHEPALRHATEAVRHPLSIGWWRYDIEKVEMVQRRDGTYDFAVFVGAFEELEQRVVVISNSSELYPSFMELMYYPVVPWASRITHPRAMATWIKGISVGQLPNVFDVFEVSTRMEGIGGWQLNRIGDVLPEHRTTRYEDGGVQQ